MNVETLPPDVRIVERMLREGFGAGDTAVVDQLCDPQLVEHQLGVSGTGAPAIVKVKEAIEQVHRGMPDLVFTVADWSQHGETVWLRAEAVGTNTGPFLGPPTGRAVRFSVIDVARVVGGRIVEHWGIPDRFALLLQLGRLDEMLPRPNSLSSAAPAATH
ncbi:ester cyclase [Microbacterium sp. NPDC056003]|uniref:ester cyclase n=1 Tax=Microbacterium sp. NPDC056003 TaxID=3345676 RepID=UPI0035D91045